MKRFLMTVVEVGVMALLLTSGAQAKSNGEGFIGLWQGVGDGGLLLTADISDIDGDEQFRIRINIPAIPALS